MQYIEQQILRLDEEIARHVAHYQKEFQLLRTIPGIAENASAAVLAEIGPDMSPFDNDGKLTSWSGFAARRGPQRAVVAVAHTLLRTIYVVLKTASPTRNRSGHR